MDTDINSQVKEKRFSNPGSAKALVQRLGRGLMLPIAILPIAGLLLGVGSGINNALISADVTAQNAYIIGNVMIAVGNVIFANLPILFAIAVAITYTDDAGGAALSAFVAWLIFNAVQTPFISDPYMATSSSGVTQQYVDIAWYHQVSSALITNNVGINSLNTSVFGGIIIGAIVAILYNKFYKLKLPAAIGFFGGVRFVPIVSFGAAMILGLGFIVVWPIVAFGIAGLGNAINGLPIGLNALFFGIIERALIPFGLHHVFYTPLWFTAAGATLNLNAIFVNGTAISQMPGVTQNVVQGDQSIWMFINSTPYLNFDDVYHISHNLNSGDTAWVSPDTGYSLTWTDSAVSQNYNPGQYLQGKFTFMIFGLPAAGAAMIMAAKKENRQVAFSVIGAAALTSFLTGITEPIEYTFLFLAPGLFYGFHVLMAGLSFWILNLAHVHAGLTFSGGIIDLVIYGLLPAVTGNPTHFWVIIVLGVIVYIPAYYFVFYFWITKRDVPTPGRTNDEIKLYSKADYQARQESRKGGGIESGAPSSSVKDLTRPEQLLVYLGGFENLKTIDACATRLRLTVNDRNLIHVNELKGLGAAGVGGSGQAVQVIFGGDADVLKSELKDMLSGKSPYNKEAVALQLKIINGQVVDTPTGGSDSGGSIDPSKLTRPEQLLAYLGNFENLKTIDACATRLRLTVNDRNLIHVNELKGLGAAGVGGSGQAVQVIFGGEADVLKSELKDMLSGKSPYNKEAVAQVVKLLNGVSTPVVEPLKEEVKIEPTPKKVEETKKPSLKEEPKAKKQASKQEHKVDKPLVKEEPKAQKVHEEKTLTKDYSKSKEKFEQKEQQISSQDKAIAKQLLDILGGKDNIVKVTNNITRMSIKLNDRKSLDEEELKKLDIKDIVGQSNSFQIVWNGEVDSIVKALNELLK